ncbi:MAG: type VII secretion target [Pseudonocardiaceae bacterium]
MNDGFTVYPADLRAHANTLDQQAERIGRARSAAQDAGPDLESFGILCQFFAIDADIHVMTAKRCLDGLGDAVSQMAGGVRDTAELYDRADAVNRTIFEGVR